MKLSEMTTMQAASALAKLSGPLSRLMKDGKLKTIIQGLANHKEDQSMFDAIADVVDSAIPMLFEDHLSDTFTVVSVMCGKSVKAVQEQKIMQTIAEVYEFTKDREFIDFLGSLKKRTEQTVEE